MRYATSEFTDFSGIFLEFFLKFLETFQILRIFMKTILRYFEV